MLVKGCPVPKSLRMSIHREMVICNSADWFTRVSQGRVCALPRLSSLWGEEALGWVEKVGVEREELSLLWMPKSILHVNALKLPRDIFTTSKAQNKNIMCMTNYFGWVSRGTVILPQGGFPQGGFPLYRWYCGLQLTTNRRKMIFCKPHHLHEDLEA